MRSYIAVFLGSLLLFAPNAFAAVVTFSGSGQFQLTDVSNAVVTMTSGEIVTSVVVTGSTMALEVESGSTVGFTSTTKMDVSVSPTAYFALSEACSSSGTTWSARNTSNGTVTVTFTLSSPGSCPQGGTSGGGSSGGSGGSTGGGGGSSASAAPAALVSAPAASPVPALISKLIPAGFKRGLALGAKGEDVNRLRQILGLVDESDLFDAALRDKLLAFQLKYKIISKVTDDGAGSLGPKTRATILKFFPKGAVVQLANPAVKEVAAKAELQRQLLTLQAQVRDLLAAKEKKKAAEPVINKQDVQTQLDSLNAAKVAAENKLKLQLQLDSLKAAFDNLKKQQDLKAAQDSLKALQKKVADQKIIDQQNQLKAAQEALKALQQKAAIKKP